MPFESHVVVMAGNHGWGTAPWGWRRHQPQWGIREQRVLPAQGHPRSPVFSLQRGPASSHVSPRAGFPCGFGFSHGRCLA